MHKFIIGTIFKELFDKKKDKPQIFIFFDSIDEINEFHEYFKARVTYIPYRHQTSPPTSPNTSNPSPSASSPAKSMRTERR